MAYRRDIEMMDLMDKAEEFVQEYNEGYVSRTRYLCRNKDSKYFKKIMKGDGIMDKSLKDESGHAGCPINGKLSGIWFNANADEDGDPFPYSPFGTERLQVPAYDLLRKCILYFANFYCLRRDGPHYITIVASKPGSDSDYYCRKRLPALDPYRNPFLRESSRGNRFVIPAMNVDSRWDPWIDVFYTHSLDMDYWLDHGAFMSTNPSGGKVNYANPRKNPYCKICDI